MEKHFIPWIFLLIGILIIVFVAALVFIKTNFVETVSETVNEVINPNKI